MLLKETLAHSERNKVKSAYNYAQYLEERAEMMQAWSDYLDKLKNEDMVKKGRLQNLNNLSKE